MKLTRRQFLQLCATLGIAGAIAALGISRFVDMWNIVKATATPPPRPKDYDYGELNYIEPTLLGDLRKGLVAEYLFYEGHGNILHDTSGHGNNGIIYGATWKQDNNGKYYLEFDGVDDYVTATLNGFNTDSGTIVGYITDPVVVIGAVAMPYNVNTKEQGIYIGDGLSGYRGVRLLMVAYERGKCGGVVYVRYPDGTYFGKAITTSYSVENGKPYFLLIQFIKVDDYHIRVKYYANGEKVYDEEYTLSKPFYAWYARPRYFAIAHGIGAWQHYFKGRVYWCIVGKRELSDHEVKILHNLLKIAVPGLG